MVLLIAALTFQIPEPPSAMDQNGKRAGYLAPPDAIARAGKLVGTTAPAVTALDTQGKEVLSKELFKKPTLLVFIEPGCPCCDTGQVYFGRLQDLYKKEANVVGLLFGSKETARTWKARNRARFAVVADPGGKVALSYRAEVGLALRLIDSKGKIVLSTPGYSGALLERLASQMGKLGRQKPRLIATFPAPDGMASGCPLGSHAGPSGNG